MQVFDNLKLLRKSHPNCVATIGKYDGMHLGHQQILQDLLGLAELKQLPSLVILSEPQPEEYFNGDAAPPRLLSFAAKVEFLQKFGIDLVYKMDFNHALSQLSALSFVEQVLVGGIGVSALVVGDDFRFGKNRAGDFALLSELGERFAFSVKSVPACLVNGERVSSTLVRQKLEAGNCDAVSELLGRPYQLGGKVVRGSQLGRELGYPTANLDVGLNRLALEGVFAVKVVCGTHSFQGAASVGYKPSIEGRHDLAVEVFLLDFEGDLYGKNLSLEFLKKIRSQQKFADLDELKKHIENDIAQVRNFFGDKAQ